MAESILKIHTQNGDVPVGYPGLADKPIADKTLSEEGAFADSKAVGDKFKEVKTETDSLKEDLVTLNGVKKTVIPTWTIGKRIDENGSLINSGTSLCVTDFIDVIDTNERIVYGLNAYSTLSMPSIHYYNESKEHIGYAYGYDTYDMSDDLSINDAKYVRLSHLINNAHPIDGVKVEFTSKGHIDDIDDTLTEHSENIEDLQRKVGTSRSTQFVNILDGHTTCENGKILSSGVLISHVNWCTLTDYIPVKPNTTYGIKFAEEVDKWVDVKITYYKSDKTFISEEIKTNNNGYLTPNETAYIRLSATNLNYNAYGHNDFSSCYMEEVASGSEVVVINNAKYNSNTFPLTTLSDKKWALFGDSITENNNRSNANYHDYIRAETGIVTINNGIGGSGYKNRDDNNNAFYQIALKTIESWENADVITVMGGVNDHWGQIAHNGLGTASDAFVEPSDITKHTTNTVMACFNKTLDVIIANAPNSRIGVISPLPCVTTQSGTTYTEVPYNENCNMSKFVVECKKACALRGIPYLDLFHNSGLRPWDSDFNAKYFKCISTDSPDGLHPNELGHKFFYPMVREFLKTLI